MISYLKRKGKINPILATILTDFASHEQWLVGHEYTDYFFVSNDNMKKELCDYGVKEDKIHVTGIPMSDRFFEKFDKENVYKMFELNPNKKVILFFGGGEFGLGCEMGISTQKLHARGPMGLRELTTYKYIIHGNGQIR